MQAASLQLLFPPPDTRNPLFAALVVTPMLLFVLLGGISNLHMVWSTVYMSAVEYPRAIIMSVQKQSQNIFVISGDLLRIIGSASQTHTISLFHLFNHMADALNVSGTFIAGASSNAFLFNCLLLTGRPFSHSSIRYSATAYREAYLYLHKSGVRKPILDRNGSPVGV